MRAAVLHTPGEAPTPGEFRDPEAGDGSEVLEVAASSINPVDTYLASGAFGPVETPSVPGKEAVGRLADGRRVYCNQTRAPFGGYAERALVPSEGLIDVPDDLPDAQAVTLGIAGMAAWLPLTEHAGVTGGERVLVLGATGIVGQVAVQGAKLLGASHVVAAGRHAATLDPLLDRGADATVTLGDDPADALAEAGGEHGFDVVIDCVFGAPFAAALGAVAPGGIVVTIGPAAGMTAELGFGALQGKRVVGHGNDHLPAEVRARAFADMARHVLAGELHVPTETFALEDIGAAWEQQLQGAHRKLVIRP